MNGFVSNKTGETITDKLGLGKEIRELKFGAGFSGNRGRGPKSDSFHTIRYDFKPASVDTSQQASLEVESNNQVTISIPHSDGNGANIFQGPRKPYAKECVLIIDHVTGEVTLEKLTDSIMVKKTRQEGGSRISGNKPIAPAPPPPLPQAQSQKKKQLLPPPPSTSSLPTSNLPKTELPPPPTTKSSKENKKKGKTQLSEPPITTSNHRGRPYSPMLNVPARHSPLGLSPVHTSNNGGSNQGNGTSDTVSSKYRSKPEVTQTIPALPSLSSIDDFLMNEPTPPVVHQSSSGTPTQKPDKFPSGDFGKTITSLSPPHLSKPIEKSPSPPSATGSMSSPNSMSQRSSGIISSQNQSKTEKKESSSSSEGSSDSSSSSSDASGSDSSDDDELMDVDDIPIAPMKHLPMLPILPSHKPRPTPAPSMPFFDESGNGTGRIGATIVSEDLQLSEESSGSDDSDSD